MTSALFLVTEDIAGPFVAGVGRYVVRCPSRNIVVLARLGGSWRVVRVVRVRGGDDALAVHDLHVMGALTLVYARREPTAADPGRQSLRLLS